MGEPVKRSVKERQKILKALGLVPSKELTLLGDALSDTCKDKIICSYHYQRGWQDGSASVGASLNAEVLRLQREINKQDDEISRLRSLIDWKN